MIAAAIFDPVSVGAAELVMFEVPGCAWCAKWHAEIGGIYPRTPEGLRLPLRAITGRVPPAGDFALDRPVTYTPTFVVVDGGREAGRITGYPGNAYFWQMLGQLIQDLDAR